MTRSIAQKSHIALQQMLEKIVSQGQISRQEHLNLTSVMLSNYELTDEDRRRINRIFDYVHAGRLKLVG